VVVVPRVVCVAKASRGAASTTRRMLRRGARSSRRASAARPVPPASAEAQSRRRRPGVRLETSPRPPPGAGTSRSAPAAAHRSKNFALPRKVALKPLVAGCPRAGVSSRRGGPIPAKAVLRFDGVTKQYPGGHTRGE
jgi:hypothetical protein